MWPWPLTLEAILNFDLKFGHFWKPEKVFKATCHLFMGPGTSFVAWTSSSKVKIMSKIEVKCCNSLDYTIYWLGKYPIWFLSCRDKISARYIYCNRPSVRPSVRPLVTDPSHAYSVAMISAKLCTLLGLVPEMCTNILFFLPHPQGVGGGLRKFQKSQLGHF